jgi:hypothetical protein
VHPGAIRHFQCGVRANLRAASSTPSCAEFRSPGIDAVYVRRNAAGDGVFSRQAPQPYATFMATRNSPGALSDAFLSPGEHDQRIGDRGPFADSGGGSPER